MPSPSAALKTLRPDLATFIELPLMAATQGLIADQVLRRIRTMVQSGQFGKIKLEELIKTRDTRRAPGAGYQRGHERFEPVDYTSVEDGWEEPVDDRERAMYASFFDADLRAAQRAALVVLLEREKRVADLVFNTTTWTGASLTTAVSNKWDVAASGTPAADVKAAKIKVADGTGLWPNAVVMDRRVFIEARETDEVRDRIASSGAGSATKAADITPVMLAQVFDVDFVIVAGMHKDTADEGQSRSVSPVWDKTMVQVCRVALTEDNQEACVGRIISWDAEGAGLDGMVEQYRDETVRSDIHRFRTDTDELVLYKELGHLLTSVL